MSVHDSHLLKSLRRRRQPRRQACSICSCRRSCGLWGRRRTRAAVQKHQPLGLTTWRARLGQQTGSACLGSRLAAQCQVPTLLWQTAVR